MSPALTDLNIAFFQQELRIRAIDTRAPQYHQPRPTVLRAHDVPKAKARKPTGFCQAEGCGRAVRWNRVLCHDYRADATARWRETWRERGGW